MFVNCKTKKMLASLVLASWIGSMPLSAIANSQVIWNNNNGYGASINDMTGANVTTALDNKIQQIQITGPNGGKITWDYLNVGKGKTLDFNFTQGGQMALNKVLTGMSKFAGTLKTSGEAGHVVISNPNGALMMKGSAINGGAGSITLTTHEIKDFDTMDLSTGKFELESAKAADGNYYGININGAKITTIGEVNIISPGIAMQNTKVSSGGMKLISADGVNFVVDSSNNSKLALEDNSIKTFKEKNENDISPDTIIMGTGYDAKKKTDTFATIQPANIPGTAIYVNKTTFNKNKKAAGDGSTAFFASNNIAFNKAKLNVDAAVIVKNAEKTIEGSPVNESIGIDIRNSTFKGTKKIGVAVTAEEALSSGGTGLLGLAPNGTATQVYAENSNIKNALIVTQSNVADSSKSGIELNKSKITNSEIQTIGGNSYISVKGKSVLSGSSLYAMGDSTNIIVSNSTINNGSITTDESMSSILIEKKSKINKSDITTNGNDSSIKVYNSTIAGAKANTTKIKTTGDNSGIQIDGSTIKLADIKTEKENSHIKIGKTTKSKLTGTNLMTEGNNVNIEIYNSTITGTKANMAGIKTTGQNAIIQINGSAVKSANIETEQNSSNIQVGNIAKSKLTNTNLSAKGKYTQILIGNGTTVSGTKKAPSKITIEGEGSSINVQNNSKLTNTLITMLGKYSNLTLGKSYQTIDTSSIAKSQIIIGSEGDENIAESSSISAQGKGATFSKTKITSNAKSSSLTFYKKTNISSSDIEVKGSSSYIQLYGTTAKNSTFKSIGSINLEEGTHVTGNGKTPTLVSTENDIYIGNNSVLNKVIVEVASSISMYNTEATKSSFVSTGDYGSTSIHNCTFKDSALLTKGSISMHESSIKNSVLASNSTDSSYVSIYNSVVSGSLIVTSSTNSSTIDMGSSTLEKTTLLTMGTGDNISMYETNITGGQIITAGDSSNISISSNVILNKTKIMTGITPKKVKTSKNSFINSTIKNTLSSFNATGENSKISVNEATIKNSTLRTHGEGAEINLNDNAQIEKSTIATKGNNAFITIEGEGTVVRNSKITTGVVTKKATKKTPAIVSGTNSHINVQSGAVIAGSKLTTIGEANINVADQAIIKNKSTINTLGSANTSGLVVSEASIENSTVNVNGVAHFTENSIGKQLKINAKGQSASVVIDGNSTIADSKINAKGVNSRLDISGNSLLDNSTVKMSKSAVELPDGAVSVKDSTVTNSTIKAVGDIYAENSAITDSAITTTKGDLLGKKIRLITTGKRGTKATSLTASKGSVGITNSTGKGEVKMSAKGEALMLDAYAHDGNLSLAGGSKTAIRFGGNIEAAGEPDYAGFYTDTTKTPQYSVENDVLNGTTSYNAGAIPQEIIDVFTSADGNLPSIVTGNLKVKGGLLTAVGNAYIVGNLDASSKLLTMVRARVDGTAKIKGKSVIDSNRAGVYESSLGVRDNADAAGGKIYNAYVYNGIIENRDNPF